MPPQIQRIQHYCTNYYVKVTCGLVLVPTMEFTYTEMVVKESERVVEVPIRRLGDCSQNSSVICYTRQNTAVVMMDYTERPLTEASRVVFLPGEKVSCDFIA